MSQAQHDPIPMFLTCPKCNERHIDEGEFATKVHHTHSCQNCGLTWRPAVGPTVGVQFLPGYKNDPVEPDIESSVDFTPVRHGDQALDERGGHPVHEGPCALDVLTAVMSLADAVKWMAEFHVRARGYLGWNIPDPCEGWLVCEAAKGLVEIVQTEEQRERAREHKALQDSIPGSHQINGPDEESGLPPHYRMNRYVYESGRVMWTAYAVDPLDHETLGFCSQKLDAAVNECKRHAQAVTKPARVESVRAERERVSECLRIALEKYGNEYRNISAEHRAGIVEGINIARFYINPER